MDEKIKRLTAILLAAPVVPVLTIEDRAVAVPLARALVAGGLTALEVTLRTAAGLDCIRAIAGSVEGANVGAGTVIDARQYEAAAKAGAKFVVSPGATANLIAAARDSSVPYLPGIATAGEAMTLADDGFRLLKFFPAEPAGGHRLPQGARRAAADAALLSDRRHSEWRTPPPTWRCRTSFASAARGSLRPARSRARTGSG